MRTLKELQARIEQADRLLAKKLPVEERLRIAKLRYLDQASVRLRLKFPALVEDNAQGRQAKPKQKIKDPPVLV
jgi:hypothetical protein